MSRDRQTFLGVEILTLAPLGATVVAFGLFPGVLLDLFGHPVEVALADAEAGTAITVDPLFVVLGIGIVVAVIGARVFAIVNRGKGGEGSSALQPTEGSAS